MLPEFLVCEFAKETLSLLVRERFGSDFPSIIDKNQIDYLYKYLDSLGCKTILLESEYVDRDYLEDYSRYYVKCFTRYGERCARLHFFSESFNHSDFTEKLQKYNTATQSALNQIYLGFIVVKPLPKTFIGKSCLKVYPSIQESQTKKVIKRTYNISLFGIPLNLETVAFQEQDKVVSACATTAIWTALQALDTKDLRTVPSCSEITLSAINHVSESSNSFPNKGLSNKQILRALDTQGYINHKISVDTISEEGKESFMNVAKSYVRSGIPIILGADVYDIDGDKVEKNDGHAVTIVGYDSNTAVYIHDDRVGPFAKATIHDILELQKEFKFDDDIDGSSWCFCLRDKDIKGDWHKTSQILIPNSMIVPNYKKVRIASDLIENTCKSLLDEYKTYYSAYPDAEVPDIFHEISLQSLSKVKERVLSSSQITNKIEILRKSAAKHLWVASFYESESNILVFELLFDSTEIPQGHCYSGVIKYYDLIYDTVVSTPLENLSKDTNTPFSTQDFLFSLIQSLQEDVDNYSRYLNDKYGEPRAPLRINKEEVEGNRLNEQITHKYYGIEAKSLHDDFQELIDGGYKIWVIAQDGALIVGDEILNKGHPTLTGFKSARIAGELSFKNNTWVLNAKSGRYSSTQQDSNTLLENAKYKFLEIFSKNKPGDIQIEKYDPK